MKLTVEIEGEARELEIKLDGSRVKALVDGRPYETEARKVQPGLYLLVVAGRVYECRMNGREGRSESFGVVIGSRAYDVTVKDPKRLGGAQTVGAYADGAAEIVAPMPGKVVRVLVEAGASVEAGAGLIVVEAMKMQNEMKSPKAGTVSTINVTPGTTVNAGDVLAVVE